MDSEEYYLRQPTPQTMKIARRMVLELERLNDFKLGDRSWQIISRYLAEMDARWEKVIAEIETRPD